MACEINRDTIKNGIVQTISEMLDDSNLFNRLEDNYEPKSLNSNYLEIVQDVNDQFGENVLINNEGKYSVSPSDNLIDSYLRKYNNIDEIYNPKSEDANNLYDEIGTRDIQTFINNNMQSNSEQIEQFRKANPNMKVQFGEEESQFDPSTNSVFISPEELYKVSLATGIPIKQVISIMTLHEMAHAASYYAIETGSNDKILANLLSKVKEYHNETPFEDVMRQGYIKNNQPYAFQNIHEFVTDAFSNPYFKEYLKSIPIEDDNIWTKLLNRVLELLGIKSKPNMYDRVVDYINSDRIQQENQEGSEHNTEEWEPELIYKGMPKTYTQAAYDMFTNDNVRDEVNKVMTQLPAAIIKIKNALDRETNKDKVSTLQRLISSYNEVRELDDSITVNINMLTQAAVIANDIKQQLVNIHSMTDDAKQVSLGYSLLQQANSLEYIQPLVNNILQIIEREGETSEIRPFTTQLRGIASVVSAVKQTFTNVTQPAVINLLTDFVGKSEAEEKLNTDIKILQDRLAGTKEKSKIELIEKQIKNYQAQLKLIPNRENFENIFQGLYEDASSGQMLFEAGMMNGHPIVNTMMKILRNRNIELSQEINPIVNRHQGELDILKKAVGESTIRKTENFYQPITDNVQFVTGTEEDENGNLQHTYLTQHMLLSNYSPDYIKQAHERDAAIEFYYKKLSTATIGSDQENIDKYRDKLDKAYADKRAFYKENAEQKFDDDVMAMYDLLEKPIVKSDGIQTTFTRERGYIFEDIEQAERRRDEELNMEVKTKIQDEIAQMYIELKELRSIYNNDGSLKEGFALELANIANEYQDLKQKNGTWELTTQGSNQFEKDVLSLQNRLDLGYINKDEFDRRVNDITVTELSDDYYTTQKALSDKVSAITEQLSELPEFRTLFKGVDTGKIREGYDTIRNITRAFRDNELTIDGSLFSMSRPELVKQIKDIQQETENLRALSQKLKGLSIQDTIRYKELRNLNNKGQLTADNLQELNDLKKKLEDVQGSYTKYKELIDEYTNILEMLADMNESSNTKYYQKELENQMAIFVKDKVTSVLEKIKNNSSLEAGKYIKTSSGWKKVLRVEAGAKVVEPIDIKGYLTVEEALANQVARESVQDQVKETDWWKNNHYQKYTWNSKQKTFTQTDTPIYIWVKSEPKNKSYIKTKQPSIKYKTYKVNDSHINPNYELLNDNIPIPKSGKFPNQRFEDLKSSSDSKSKAYSNYLEFIRRDYRASQGYYADNRKMADILPSFIKTHNELKVESVENLKGRMSNVIKGNLKLGLGSTEDTDEQTLTGGSTTNEFAKNRRLPTRFSNKMDVSKQSTDIPAMILGFNIAALEYNKMSKEQPLLEAIREHVEGLDVQQTKALASKFSIHGLFSSIKSTVTKTSTKEVEQTNLSKTVNHILDTFLYKETKKSANVNIAGMDFDLNKASSELKKFSSMSIFALNSFVAVKNTISATIQGNIQSNISKGFFTKAQYNTAHGEAIRLTGNFIHDFRKFGNKSKIGQELDYFQVLQGAAYNEFGAKTAWTNLKNTVEYLTLLKNSSEFELQVAQYIAMSKANPVKVNGQYVEWRKAFEIGKDGNLVKVDGAEVSEEDIKRFVHKLSYINRIINGAYRQEEKNALQKNVLGDLAFYLNGYLVPGIVARFGKTRYTAEGDMITRGYHNQMLSFLGDMIKYKGDIKEKWNIMTVDERNRVKRSLNEISSVIAMGILVAIMGGNSDKKELKNNAALKNWLLATAIAVKSETETFMPFPGMGLNEMSRKMNSPFAALRQISNIVKTLENLSLFIVNNPSAYYKTTGVKDGLHDKGDAKFIANFLKLVGYSGVGFNPVDKVMQQNRIQKMN